MFSLKKRAVSYETGVIENVIGVGLPNRNKFMNYGDVAAENIYSGFAIGRIFLEDQDRLSFEFDAVYLHYLMSVLTDAGIPAAQGMEALQAVLDNFGISKAEQKRFRQRLKDYASLTDPDIADKFIDNLNVTDFPDNFREPSRKILGGQFKALSKAIGRFVRDELRAAHD